MDFFRLHFFKANTRDINIEAVIAFFEVIDGITIDDSNNRLVFNYVDPRLDLTCRFFFMPKSQVKEIYRLDPKYYDLNFQLEISTLAPDFFVEKVLQITKRLVDKFSLFVFHETFVDVLQYRRDLVMNIFMRIKQKYLELNPKLLNEYALVRKDKLHGILRYLNDIYELQKHYQQEETIVPFYLFMKMEDKSVKVAFEWKYDTLTVLPIYLDYIIVNKGNDSSIINADEFYEVAGKYLEEVPGFLKGTYVVPKKNLKKINKILKKYKFSKIKEAFEFIKHTKLID
jgi:hypothetical protein